MLRSKDAENEEVRSAQGRLLAALGLNLMRERVGGSVALDGKLSMSSGLPGTQSWSAQPCKVYFDWLCRSAGQFATSVRGAVCSLTVLAFTRKRFPSRATS